RVLSFPNAVPQMCASKARTIEIGREFVLWFRGNFKLGIMQVPCPHVAIAPELPVRFHDISNPPEETRQGYHDIMPLTHPASSTLVASALAVLVFTTPVNANPIEDFYKGKTITIVTSTGVGGPFDLTARALAKHMPKYLPGRPTMIVRNMPGGGHVLATNYMY